MVSIAWPRYQSEFAAAYGFEGNVRGSALADDQPHTGIVEYLSDQGGLLAPIVGKEAAKALTTFIGGALVIPNAWFARIARGIQDDADARSTIKKALAEKVAEHAIVDDALLMRMSNRWLGEEVKKQINREAVSSLAFEDLRQSPPEKEVPVGDDFLSRFTSHAEQASTDEMQKLFGRILAGEIRKPGSYSLAALHVLSIMDAQLAKTVEEVSAWILEDFIPFSGSMTSGPGLEKISILEDLGLVRSGLITRKFERNSKGLLIFAARHEVNAPAFSCDCSVESVNFDVALITPVGQQIFKLTSPQWTDDDVRTVGSALKAQHGVACVKKGVVAVNDSGAFIISGIVPFDPPLID